MSVFVFEAWQVVNDDGGTQKWFCSLQLPAWGSASFWICWMPTQGRSGQGTNIDDTWQVSGIHLRFSKYQLNPGRAVPGRTSTISPMRFLPRCLRMHLAGRPARTALQRDEALPNTDDKKVCWWNVVDVLIYRYLADIW